MLGQLSGVCRYPAGVLTGARIERCRNWPTRLSVSQGVSLGDFLLAPTCPIEKLTLWEGFLYLTLGSKTNEGAVNSGLRTPDPLDYHFTLPKAQYAIH